MTVLAPLHDKRRPSKGEYDTIVYINGPQVIAENADGKVISCGMAGTDDGNVIKASILAAHGGLIVLKGRFTLSAQLSVSYDESNKINILGNNCVISWIGAPRTGADTYKNMLYFYGKILGYATSIDSNVTSGDDSIHVIGLNGGVQQDDLVQICDDTIWNFIDHPNVKTGELHAIQSYSSHIIKVYDYLINSFTTANNAKVIIYRPIEVHIENISFVAPSSTEGYSGIRLVNAYNSSIKCCKFMDFGDWGIQIITSAYIDIDKCNISGSLSEGYGYGVAVTDATYNIVVRNCKINRCRHGFSLGSYGCVGQPRLSIIERNIIEIDTTLSNSVQCCIDAHAIAESLIINGNTLVVRTTGRTNQGLPAIQSGAKYTEIKNNNINGYGISSRGSAPNVKFIIHDNTFYEFGLIFEDHCNSGTSASYDYLSVKNNTIISKTRSLGWTSVLASHFSRVDVVGNKLDNSYSIGISVTKATSGRIAYNEINGAGSDGVYIKTCSNLTVEHNRIENCSQLWDSCESSDCGISIADSSYILVKDNIITDTTGRSSGMRYGIKEYGASDYNIIENNYVAGAITKNVDLLGPSTKFIYFNWALSTSFAVDEDAHVSVAIAHGLQVTPTISQCQITVVKNSEHDDYLVFPRIISCDATSVIVDVWVWHPSGSAGATAKLSLMVI